MKKFILQLFPRQYQKLFKRFIQCRKIIQGCQHKDQFDNTFISIATVDRQFYGTVNNFVRELVINSLHDQFISKKRKINSRVLKLESVCRN